MSDSQWGTVGKVGEVGDRRTADGDTRGWDVTVAMPPFVGRPEDHFAICPTSGSSAMR